MGKMKRMKITNEMIEKKGEGEYLHDHTSTYIFFVFVFQ